MEYQPGKLAEWRKTIYDDPIFLDIPDPDPEDWASSLEALHIA